MTTSTMSTTAFHEIGHALINYTKFYNINNLNQLTSISIVPKNGSRGRNTYSEQYFIHSKEIENKYKIISPNPITTNDIDKLKKECLTKIAGVISENVYYAWHPNINKPESYYKKLDTHFTAETAIGEVRTDHLKFQALYNKLNQIDPNVPDFKKFSNDCWNKIEGFYKKEENKLLLIECSYILSKEKKLQGSTLINYFSLGKQFITTCKKIRDNLISDHENITITYIIELLKEDENFETLITGETDYFTIEKKVQDKLK